MLKDGMRGTSPRGPLRSALVMAQVAVALVLLAGRACSMRS